jgi:hypothetical protein
MVKKLNLIINKVILLKLSILLVIGALYLGRSLNDFEVPYVDGDGFEYILTTEAYCNHGSADIRLSDLESFKQECSNQLKQNWNSFPKREYIDNLIDVFKKVEFKYKTSFGEFFVNKSGKTYSHHFFAYSLINVPIYTIFRSTDPLRAFYVTNAIFVIIVCFLLLFFTPFSVFNSILATLSFCFSASYWYLGWQHTEIFTMCFVAMGLILFFRENYYLALFLIALACTQNQPLIPILGYLAIVALIRLKIKPWIVIKIGLACFIAFLPPIFYYLNYETTSLIKDAGFMDPKYITVNRVFGFFFDLNQGMILTIPFILFCFIAFIVGDLKNFIQKKQPFEFLILMPFLLILIATITSSMGNWNHGMAIINRYATWTSIIVMISTFYLANKKSLFVATIFFNYFFVTQIVTTLYHQDFNNFDWSQGNHRPFAKWVLRYHPNLYNPDPVIFTSRSQRLTEFKEDNSPFVLVKDNRINKILIHKDKINDLENFGVPKDKIEKIKREISYNYNWGYVDRDDFFSSPFAKDRIMDTLAEFGIKAVIRKIKADQNWYKAVESKSKEQNIAIEKALYNDAKYTYFEYQNQLSKE